MSVHKRLRRRRDGTTYVCFIGDAGRNPHTKRKERREFDTAREAKAFVQSVLDRRKGEPLKDLTVRELGERYVENRKSLKRSPSTYGKYAEHFRNHICKMVLSDGSLMGTSLGAHRLRDLDIDHFNQFVEDLDRTRSRDMAIRVRNTLRRALNLAVRKKWVSANLLLSVESDHAYTPEASEVEIPTEEELGKILRKIAWNKSEPVCLAQAYIETALGSGLRPGEQRALPWTNVHIDKRPYSIEVKAAIDEKGRLKRPKTAAGVRSVPITESLAELLRAWRQSCPKSPRNLVFPTSGGTYYSHSNLDNRVWKPVQIAAGVYDQVRGKNGALRKRGRYRFYALRHTYASLQIEIDVKPIVLARRMGHKSAAFTMKTYVKQWEKKERDEADAQKMDAWLESVRSAK